MPAFRVAAGPFLLLAIFLLLGLSASFVQAQAAEEKCDAKSETSGNVVSNDCKICVTTVTGEKKWVGASCTVTGGGDKTAANCAANHGVAPGTCATKYCVGTKCFDANNSKKPELNEFRLKDETDLNNLQNFMSKAQVPGVTPVKDDPTAGQLQSSFDQSPSLEKVPADTSALSPGDVDKALNELAGQQGLDPEAKAEQLLSAQEKAAQLQAQGRDARVQVESTLTPEQRAQLLAEHGIDPKTLDPRDPLAQYADKGVTETFGKPYDPYGLGSCTGLWCTIKQGFQDLFSGDKTNPKLLGFKDATIYCPGGCPGSPIYAKGKEGPRIGSRDQYIDSDMDVVAAGGKDLKFGDVVKVTNPETGLSDQGVIGDVLGCYPNCSGRIDLTEGLANKLGFYDGHKSMQVEVVSRGNSWSEGLAQAQSLNDSSPSVAWGDSIAQTPTNVTISQNDWSNITTASPSTQVAGFSGTQSAGPSGRPQVNTAPGGGSSVNTIADTNFRPVQTPPILSRRDNVAQSGGQSSGNNISQYPTLYPQPTPPVLQGSVPNTGVPPGSESSPQPTPLILQSRVPNTGVTPGSDASKLAAGSPGSQSGVAVTQAPGQRWQDGVNQAIGSATKALNDLTKGAQAAGPAIVEGVKSLGSAAVEKIASIGRGESADKGGETTGQSAAQSTGGKTDNYAAPGRGSGAITETSQKAPAREGSAAILDAGQRRASPSTGLTGGDAPPTRSIGEQVAPAVKQTWEDVWGTPTKEVSPIAPTGGGLTTEAARGKPPTGNISLEHIGPPPPGQGTPGGSGELGDKGKYVYDLQRALNAVGPKPIAEDGQPGSPGHETNEFGPKTLAGVKAFQKANDLTPDGIVGPETRAALNKAIEAQNSAQSAAQSSVGAAPAAAEKIEAIASGVGASPAPSSQGSTIPPIPERKSVLSSTLPPIPERKPAPAPQSETNGGGAVSTANTTGGTGVTDPALAPASPSDENVQSSPSPGPATAAKSQTQQADSGTQKAIGDLREAVASASSGIRELSKKPAAEDDAAAIASLQKGLSRVNATANTTSDAVKTLLASSQLSPSQKDIVQKNYSQTQLVSNALRSVFNNAIQYKRSGSVLAGIALYNRGISSDAAFRSFVGTKLRTQVSLGNKIIEAVSK